MNALVNFFFTPEDNKNAFLRNEDLQQLPLFDKGRIQSHYASLHKDISNKLLHAIAGMGITSSGLEETSLSSLTHFYQTALRRLENLNLLNGDKTREASEAIESIQTADQKMVALAEISKTKDNSKLDESAFAELAKKFKDQIVGTGSLWIKLTNPGKGTTICYFTSNQVTLINCHDALDNHSKASFFKCEEHIDREKIDVSAVEEIRYQQFVTYSGIKFNKIEDFLKKLIAIEVESKKFDFIHSSKMIYEAVDFLEGQKEPAFDPNRHPLAYHKQSRSADPTAKTLSRMIHLIFMGYHKTRPPLDPVKNHLFYKLSKIVWGIDLLTLAMPNLDQVPFQRNLILDLIANLKQALRKLHEERGSEFLACREVNFDQLEEILNGFKSNIPKEKTSLNNRLDLRDLRVANITNPMWFSLPLIEEKEEHSFANIHSEIDAIYTQISNLSKKKINSKKDFINRINTLVKLAYKVSSIVNSENHILEQHFLNLFLDLPMPLTKSGSILNDLDDNEVRAVIDGLYVLIEATSDIRSKLKHTKESVPLEGVIGVHACLACVDYLTRKQFHEFFVDAPPTDHAGLLIALKNPAILLSFKAWEPRLNEILYYFASEEKKGIGLPHSQEWINAMRFSILERTDNQESEETFLRELMASAGNLFSTFTPYSTIIRSHFHTISLPPLDEPSLPNWKTYHRWVSQRRKSLLKGLPVIDNKINLQLINSNVGLIFRFFALRRDENEVFPPSLLDLKWATWYTLRYSYSMRPYKELSIEWGISNYGSGFPFINLNSNGCDLSFYSRVYELSLERISLMPFNQNLLVSEQKEVDDMTSIDYAELRMITSDPFDIPFRALSFFKLNIHLLLKPELRTYLKKVCLRPAVIESQRATFDHFSDYVIEWTKFAFAHFIKINEFNVAMSVIDIGRQLLLASAENPSEGFKQLRQNLEEESESLLKQNEFILSYCHLKLSLYWLNELDDENKMDCYIDYFKTLMYQDLDDNNKILFDSKFYFAAIKTMVSLTHTQITREEWAKVYQALSSLVNSKSDSIFIECSYPNLKGSKISFNLEKGFYSKQVNEDPLFIGKLPSKWLESSLYMQVCKDRIVRIETVRKNVFNVTFQRDKHEYNLELYQNWAKQLIIKKKVGAYFHVAVNPKECGVGFLEAATFLWYKVNDAQQIIELEAIFPQNTFHIGLEPDGNRMVSTTVKGDNGLYWISPKLCPPVLHEFFNKIQIRDGNLRLWADIQKNIKSISFPDWNLTFNKVSLNGVTNFYLNGTSFYLSSQQNPPRQFETLGFVVENNKGQRRFVVPCTDLKRSESKLEKKLLLTTDHFYYDIEEEGDLSSTNFLGSLYLAYMYLCAGDFQKAWDLLDQIHPLKPLNQKETILLFYLFKESNEHLPLHPKVIVLNLKIYCIARKNALKFLREESRDLSYSNKELLKQYERYLQQLGNLFDFRLMREDELFIIDLLQNGAKDSLERQEGYFGFLERRKRILQDLVITPHRRLWEVHHGEMLSDYIPKPIREWMRLRLTTWFPDTQISEVNDYLFKTLKIYRERSELNSLWMSEFNKNNGSNWSYLSWCESDRNFCGNGYFFFLYAIAKNLPRERTRLQLFLSFIDCGPDFYIVEVMKQILFAVIKSPSEFPNVEEITDGDLIQLLVKVPFEEKLRSIKERCLTVLSSEDQTRQSINSKSTIARIKPTDHPLMLDFDSMNAWDKGKEAKLLELLATYFSYDKREPIKTEARIPIPQGDPAVTKKITLANSKIDDYQSNLKIVSEYRLNGGKEKELMNELKLLISCEKSIITNLKENLLEQVNRKPKGSLTTRYLGREAATLNWEKLKQICKKKDSEVYFKNLTFLTDEKIPKIIEQYALYLAYSSRIKQVERAIDWLTKCPDPQAEHSAADELSGIRNYSIEKKYLSRMQLEEYKGIFLRPEQNSTIDALKRESKEISIQYETGGGKSTTVMPTVNEELTGDFLPINVQPPDIEWPSTNQLRNSLKKTFQKGIDRFEFNVGSKITPEGLRVIYNDLLININGGRMNDSRPLSLPPEFLSSLELYYIKLLDACVNGKVSEVKRELLTESIRILRLLRCKGWAIFDEIQIILALNRDTVITPTFRGWPSALRILF